MIINFLPKHIINVKIVECEKTHNQCIKQNGNLNILE